MREISISNTVPEKVSFYRRRCSNICWRGIW